MQETGNNSFNEGMNSDAHPMVTKATQSVDALNMELTTTGEEQYLLQNIPGNLEKFKLTDGFIPLAIKSNKDIAYIVSGKFGDNGAFELGEIGTFPSPDWSKLGYDGSERDIPIDDEFLFMNADNVGGYQYASLGRDNPSVVNTTVETTDKSLDGVTQVVPRYLFDFDFKSNTVTNDSPDGGWLGTAASAEGVVTSESEVEPVSAAYDENIGGGDFIDWDQGECGGDGNQHDELCEDPDGSGGSPINPKPDPVYTWTRVSYRWVDYDIDNNFDVTITKKIRIPDNHVGENVKVNYSCRAHNFLQSTGKVIGSDASGNGYISHGEIEDINGFTSCHRGHDTYFTRDSFLSNTSYKDLIPDIKYPYFAVAYEAKASSKDLWKHVFMPCQVTYIRMFGLQTLRYFNVDIGKDRNYRPAAIDTLKVHGWFGATPDTLLEEFYDNLKNEGYIMSVLPSVTMRDMYQTFVNTLKVMFVDLGALAMPEDVITLNSARSNSPVEDGNITTNFIDKYSPLHNFLTDEFGDTITDDMYDDDGFYVYPYRTNSLNFGIRQFIDLTLQEDYDRTINMIFTDDKNPIKLINTRFRKNEDGTATLMDRSTVKDSNTYSARYHKSTDLLLSVDTIPELVFKGIEETGKLFGGGYRYYFRYKTQEGDRSDIIEESRLVSIFRGDEIEDTHGVQGDEVTQKSVRFSLSNLDPAFSAIEVSFTHIFGEDSVTAQTYVLEEDFYITTAGTAEVFHSGYERYRTISSEELNETTTDIAHAKTLEQVNDRLAIGNISGSNNEALVGYMQKMSAEVTINSVKINSKIKDLYKANNMYHNVSHWPGETYELGIVYVLKTGLSPVFPLRGIDNIEGNATYVDYVFTGNENILYDQVTDTGSFENILGVYRTQELEKLSILPDVYHKDDVETVITTMSANVSRLVADVDNKIIGYFFVRKDRKKDALYAGIVTHTIQVPTSNFKKTSAEFVGFERNTTYLNYNENVRYVGYTSGMKLPAPTKPVLEVDFTFNYVPCPVGMLNLIGFSTIAELHGDLQETEHTALYIPDLEIVGNDVVSEIDSTTKFLFFDKNSRLTTQEHGYASLWGGDMVNPEGYKTDFFYQQNGGKSYSGGTYASSTDRTLNYLGAEKVGYYWPNNLTTFGTVRASGSASNTGNKLFSGYGLSYTAIWALLPGHDNRLQPYMSLSNNYGQYVGATLSGVKLPNIHRGGPRKYGHIALILSAITRRTKSMLFDIYANPDKSGYYAISKRFKIDDISSPVTFEDGDAFVGRIHKKLTYPIGIVDAPSAGPGDSGKYGLGPAASYDEGKTADWNDDTWANATAVERRDEGRLLTPQSTNISYPTISTHNFMLRSKEFHDALETELFGKRSFTPLIKPEEAEGIYAPESKKYNRGYSGDWREVAYSSIDVNAPVTTLTYQNRVVISAPNIPSEFVNGYRDIRGINHKDYNSELGSIQKLINNNNILFCAFEYGVAIITVDGRTLINDQSSIYVDDAQALASKAQVLSSAVGSINPESVVSSYTSVYGVDRIRNKVWGATNKGVLFISDFAIQTHLNVWRDKLDVTSGDGGKLLAGVPRIYGSTDDVKKTVIFSFNKLLDYYKVAEGSNYHIDTIFYSEIAKAWVSRLSSAYKFNFKYKSRSIMFSVNNSISTAWETDVNPLYCNFEGINYDSMVEFIMHDRPDVEKILNNLMLMSNKVKPHTITYTTTKDISDANILQAGVPFEEFNVYEEEIKTRLQYGNSKLGIFNENAYYKDGKYFIQVGKQDNFSRYAVSSRKIRDKYIKIKITYTSNLHVYVQAVVSLFTINYD